MREKGVFQKDVSETFLMVQSLNLRYLTYLPPTYVIFYIHRAVYEDFFEGREECTVHIHAFIHSFILSFIPFFFFLSFFFQSICIVELWTGLGGGKAIICLYVLGVCMYVCMYV